MNEINENRQGCQFPISNRSPPEDSAINEAERCLKVLEALDGSGRLIPFGKAMAHFPPASMLLSLRNISYGTHKDVDQSWTISSAKEEEIIGKAICMVKRTVYQDRRSSINF
ncbi:hypothetical protein ACFE04_026966 [Oxalis oulophora]